MGRETLGGSNHHIFSSFFGLSADELLQLKQNGVI
jgi:hypothetical protein